MKKPSVWKPVTHLESNALKDVTLARVRISVMILGSMQRSAVIVSVPVTPNVQVVVPVPVMTAA